MGIESIGIIPDGTRRWAKRKGISLSSGYIHAFANLSDQIDALLQRSVKQIHIYMFSIYNLKRSKNEIIACLDAESEFIKKLVEKKIPVIVLGDIEKITNAHAGIGKAIDSIPLHHNLVGDETTIYLYIGYSFIRHLEMVFSNELSISSAIDVLTARKLDLIIRTGGAITLSDFLPIESRYAQLHFLPTLFNDFTVSDLIAICNQHEEDSITFKHGE